MDTELWQRREQTRVSTTTSSSSSASSSSAARISDGEYKCGADRMVKSELEAAEALAGLAHSAMRETERPGSESGEKWGIKAKRASKRVKNVSPARDSDLAEVRAVVDQQCEKICRNIMIKTVKVEEDAELPKPSPVCTTSYASVGGGKSKQNLTEAEKEARKLRRVLANRESARQTIRRRQALCEELTRKAADLAWENENLKREKELAVKEYESLRSTNEHLKAQMTETLKTPVEKTPGEPESKHVEIPTSLSTNCPLLVYNRPPFTPFLWSSIIQSSNPVQSQHGPQNVIAVSSKVSMPAAGKPDSSHKQEYPININGPRTPLYILPCPWFFPLSDHGNGLHPQPSFSLKDKQDETSMNNQYSAGSSIKATEQVQNRHSSLPIQVKTEASSSIEAKPANNVHETPFPLDGGVQHVGPHPQGMILVTAPLSSVKPAFTVRHENGFQPDYTPNVEAVSSTASHIASAFPEKTQEPVTYPSRKLVDAVGAAEARKRRKDLAKLKNLHETPFPLDGGVQHVGPHRRGTILMPAPLSSVKPAFTVKHENGLQPDYTPNVEAVSSTSSHIASALPEKNQEPVTYPSRKLVDAVGAAEARKRRKELTKLKNLHARQYRMHC